MQGEKNNQKKHYLLFRTVPTMRCNYRCNYCFVSPQEKSTTETMFDEHTPNEWIRAMKNFDNYEVEFYFWGGEPFLIDGTYDIVRGWTQYNHVINGSRIDTNMAFSDKIADKCPTDKLKLNCSWHTQYDSLDKIYKKVKKLNNLGMVGMTNFVASQYNLKVLRDKYHLSIDELIRKFEDIGVFLNIAADFSIVNNKAPSSYADYKRMILKYQCPEDWKQLRCEKSPSFCEANHHYFTIHANGDITSCQRGQVCGNFFDGTLELPECTVCDKKCPSLVSYCFRTDNNFSYKRHLVEYVNRNREYRNAISASKSVVCIHNNDLMISNRSYTSLVPSVSIILPTYNHLRFLPKAVESVLRQTFSDFELIIVNDGSTDGTHEYLDSLKDPRIRITHQKNKNLPEALNTGFRTARGELLTWISADNYCAPIFLEKFVSAMDANPKAGLAYSAFARIDEHDQITKVTRCPNMDYKKLLLHFPGMASFMYRRICQEKVGFYDPALEGAEDWDMWLRIIEQFPFVYVSDVLYYYRQHEKSLTYKKSNMIAKSSLQVFQNAINRLRLESLYPSLEYCKGRTTAEFHACFDFGTALIRSRYGLQTGAVCKFLEKAFSLRPDSLEATSNLAVACALSGQWEKTVPLLKTMQKTENPKVLNICRDIIEAYQAQKTDSLLSTDLFEVDKNNSELFQSGQGRGRDLLHEAKTTSETWSPGSIDDKSSGDSAVDYFIKAGEELNRGNFEAAVEYMQKYRSMIDYSKLPRILNKTDRSSNIDVSVIIVTYNRTEDLKNCLESLSKQGDANFEVIVVDNGGSDFEAFQQYVNQYIKCPINLILSEGRNIGACCAKGKIIAFLDDDALVLRPR